MPAPTSLVPPRPGDGSGICEYPDDPKYQPNEYDSDSYARYVRKRRREGLEKKAYRAFRELFSDEDDGNSRTLDTGSDRDEDLRTDGGTEPAREAVLALVDERVDVDSPWIGRRSLREQARKETHDLTLDEFDRTYYALRADVEIVTWHGLTTLPRDGLLAAILDQESDSGLRTQLVARINRVRAGRYRPSTVEPADADSEGAVP